MDKLEYFLLALANNLFTKKMWTIRCFSVTADKPLNIPYMLNREGNTCYFFDGEGNRVDITGTYKGPLYDFREVINLKANSIPNLKVDVETTYGLLFVNYSVLVYAFGNKVNYINETIKVGKVESIIEKLLIDNGAPNPEGNLITVDEYLKYGKAMFQLGGYSQLCVPSASPKTLTRNPETIKLRDRLLKEYKDSLDDPVIAAKIEAELMASDREWVDDDGKDFCTVSKKAFPNRKKAQILYGLESAFTEKNEKGTFVSGSLAEGLDFPTNMVPLVNNTREGSLGRGYETQLGGVKAKEAIRSSQNIKISQKDCGTKLSDPELVTSENKHKFINFYFSDKVGKPVLIDENNINTLINTRILLRSPMICKTNHGDYCETCMGVENSRNPNGANALASGIGSTFLLEKMKKMHGSAKAVAQYKFEMVIQ